MNNFFDKRPSKGQEHWISRSVSVVMFVFCKDLRGEGTPDQNLNYAWNCQCGYLDYNETTQSS